MENATFTLAEITGVSAWEALATVWWVPALLFFLVGVEEMGMLFTALYRDSRLQRRVQRIRWKIAAHICPEMEQMADECVDLKYVYNSEAIRVD